MCSNFPTREQVISRCDDLLAVLAASLPRVPKQYRGRNLTHHARGVLK